MKIISTGNLMLFIGRSNLTVLNDRKTVAGIEVGIAVLRAKDSEAKHRILQARIESS